MLFFIAVAFYAFPQIGFNDKTLTPEVFLEDKKVISIPDEGLWGIATNWSDKWMKDWVYANPEKIEVNNGWTILSGKIEMNGGVLFLKDFYRKLESGLIQCRRRFEWKGDSTLRKVNLSVRLRVAGDRMSAFLPGIIYYGNKNGAKVNPNVIPVYNGLPGEFAVFEDHRFPMPFVMLENVSDKYAVAMHFTPSPVRGAVLSDQWWSAGVEAGNGYTDIVMYSGPIGYNGRHAVAKALQSRPMEYDNTYLDLEPDRIVEKEFFIELDVYGVLFAPEVYKMGNYLGDSRLKSLARVMYRSCFQLTNAYGS